MSDNQPSRVSAAGGSIRTRLFLLASGMVAISVVLLLITTLTAANRVIQTAQNTSTDSLRQQVGTYLAEINRGIAERNALVLDRAVRDVRTVASAAASIYGQEMTLQPVSVILDKGPDGQYLNPASDISSVFVPNVAISRTLKNSGLSLALTRDVEQSAYLDLTLKAIKENNPNAGAVYLGTKNDVLRYYPNIEIGKVVPADFQVTQRPWYISALEGNMGTNQVQAIWSPVYYDATGLGLVTTVAVPVYDRHDTLVGVAGLDVTLAEIQASLQGSGVSQSGYSFLIDDSGMAIILPPNGWRDLLNREPDTENPTPNLLENVSDQQVKDVLQSMMRGESGLTTLTLSGQEYELAYTAFKSANQDESNTGWSLATLVPGSEVLQSVVTLQEQMRQTTRQVIFTRIMPIILLMAAALLLVAWFGSRNLSDPVLKLSQAAEKLGAGLWDEPMPQLRQMEQQNDNEYGLLARTLSSMGTQLKQSFGRLEQRVAERTQELERRSVQLQTASEIGREVTQAKDLETMLTNAVNLISQRYGYYNVGIFLVDETSEYAHLKAASGELGKKLMEREIRLRVGQQGIVGYVTRYGQARLASDVRTDRAYVSNAILADTRSEVTLPLRSGPKVIGALDVQSTRPLAFNEDDITSLQTLADQLAIAIENVRLVTRLQATLEEANLLYQQQARQAWERMTRQSGAAQYEYNLLEVKRLAHASASSEMGKHGRILQVPVMLRDQMIGMIGIESDSPEHEWTEDELAILQATANQAALSVENARLLAESQRRAAREQLAAEVTANMRASLDMETVLQTSIRELAQRLGIAQVEVHLGEMEDQIEDQPGVSDEAATAAHEPAALQPQADTDETNGPFEAAQETEGMDAADTVVGAETVSLRRNGNEAA